MTPASPLLCICIPTYNRSSMLFECLGDTISKVSRFNFPIIVTDNHSSDDTEAVVAHFSDIYPHLIYHRHCDNLGADLNFESCLNLSPARYSWLLGDSYRIVESELDSIVRLLEHDQHCAIISNCFDRVSGIDSCVYVDSDKLLYDLGWHMTIMCSLILRNDLISNATFARYHHTNFIQNGIIFEHLAANADASVYWYNANCNTSSDIKKESWLNHRWDIFGVNWSRYVLSLPSSISLPSKLKCIKEHNQKSHLFSSTKATVMRLEGSFDLSTLQRCKPYLGYFCDIRYSTLHFIAIAPKWLLRFRIFLSNFVKTLRKKH